jgi:acylphosphatase
MPHVRKRLLYSGRVQGVGFRFTAQRHAVAHGVHGYVRNLPTGDVELLAIGSPDAVEGCLRDLQASMRRNIAATTELPAVTEEELSSFEIRH